MNVWMRRANIVFFLSAAALAAHAQGTPIPVKPGLWDLQVSVARATVLPPEAEARIAALPPDQQAQVRAMMSAGAGGKPIVTTKQVCFAARATMDSLMNQAQQASGMQCTITNRVQTARGGSYDMSCTGPMGSAKGHNEFRLVDEEHMGNTMHMTVTGSAQGRSMNSTLDSTTTGKFVKADCGDVKPVGGN